MEPPLEPKNYFMRLPKRSRLAEFASQFYLDLLVMLGNNYARLHNLRTQFIAFGDCGDAEPKLIVHVENPRDVVKAVELAAWTERVLPQIENEK